MLVSPIFIILGIIVFLIGAPICAIKSLKDKDNKKNKK